GMNYAHDLRCEYARLVTRRWFFRQCSVGLGSIALSSLLGAEKAFGAGTAKATDPLAPRSPHFKPKAKRVIYLFMAGAPSHEQVNHTFGFGLEMRRPWRQRIGSFSRKPNV